MKSFFFAVLLVSMSFAVTDLRAAEGEKHLVHVVCVKFNENVTPEQIKKVQADFRALKSKIPQIVSYEGGSNISPERAKGFAHCGVVTFKSKEDLDTYINHPEHKAFAASFKELVADVFVMDFWEGKE